MDTIDRQIVALLQQDGKRTHVEIARLVSLTPPSVLERIKKLCSAGIIRRYTVLVDAEKVGSFITAFINVRLVDRCREEEFLAAVCALDEVLECHRVTGNYSFILKVKTGSPHDLNTLLTQQIREVPGVSSTCTNVVLESSKEESEVSLKFCSAQPPSSRVSAGNLQRKGRTGKAGQ